MDAGLFRSPWLSPSSVAGHGAMLLSWWMKFLLWCCLSPAPQVCHCSAAYGLCNNLAKITWKRLHVDMHRETMGLWRHRFQRFNVVVSAFAEVQDETCLSCARSISTKCRCLSKTVRVSTVRRHLSATNVRSSSKSFGTCFFSSSGQLFKHRACRRLS